MDVIFFYLSNDDTYFAILFFGNSRFYDSSEHHALNDCWAKETSSNNLADSYIVHIEGRLLREYRDTSLNNKSTIKILILARFSHKLENISITKTENWIWFIYSLAKYL